MTNSLNTAFLETLKCSYKDFQVFIETGTCLGTTIFALENEFEKLYTIELDETLFAKTKRDSDTITFLRGDSSIVLPSLLGSSDFKTYAQQGKRVIIFLDGHWSGGETGRGEKDVPLKEEVTAIMKCCEMEAVIIIDDFRLFETNVNENWSDIHKQDILDIVSDRLLDHYHLPSLLHPLDKFVLHIQSGKNL